MIIQMIDRYCGLVSYCNAPVRDVLEQGSQLARRNLIFRHPAAPLVTKKRDRFVLHHSSRSMPSLSGLIPGSRSATPVQRQPSSASTATTEGSSSVPEEVAELAPPITAQHKPSQISQSSSISGLGASTSALVNRGPSLDFPPPLSPPSAPLRSTLSRRIADAATSNSRTRRVSQGL